MSKGAEDAVRFYQQAFEAKEIMRIDAPGGLIGHVELQIGDSKIFMADECIEGEFHGPFTVGGTPVSLLLFVDDVDVVFDNAIELGAKELRPVQDQFYGDRSGTLQDPFGHVWSLSTHKEDVSHEEMQRRARELFAT